MERRIKAALIKKNGMKKRNKRKKERKKMLINGLFENGYVVYAAALFYGVCACVDCVVRPPDAQHSDSLWLETSKVETHDKEIFSVSLRQYGKTYCVNLKTGRPRAICGQRYPLPCFEWLWFGVRGSRPAAPKGMMSCRTQGDFCPSIVCLSMCRF